MPQAVYEDGSPEGKDLHRAVKAMKQKAVPGLDGWRVHELQMLPLSAWEVRARNIKIQEKTGEVPEAYSQVGTPMLPNIRKTKNKLEHRPLSIFSVLWRIESSAWYQKLKPWQEKWVHKNVYGARPGREMWESSWALQARFEEAGQTETNRSVAALDYEKYFDMFDVEFETNRLEFMGYPKCLAKMQRGLYSKLKRHIKIAGC